VGVARFRSTAATTTDAGIAFVMVVSPPATSKRAAAPSDPSIPVNYIL